jgi:outer membrane protein assembly factor BamB
MQRSLIALLAAAVTSFGSYAATDWPQYRGPAANGIAADTGINKNWKAKPPKELWRITLGDKGYAGPCVAAGKLFIIDHEGTQDIVRAINIADGKEAWRAAYDEPGAHDYGFARSTPVFDAGKLYTLSRNGIVNCFDAEKGGKPLWTRNIKADFKGVAGRWHYSASPIVDGNKLIVLPGGPNASVVALDKTNGKDIWAGGGSDKAGYATPVVATIGGKKQYVVFTGFNLIGVDAEKGGPPLWSTPWKTEYDVNAAMPIVMDDTVFITSNYGHGCALVSVSGGKAEKKWENALLQSHFNSPVLHNGFIYGIGDGGPGKLICLDPKTGKEQWSQPGFGKGGVAIVDGVLIAIDGKGGDVVMVSLNSTKYEELGRIKPLGGQSWTMPVIADGKMYIRNLQALVCLDLK